MRKFTKDHNDLMWLFPIANDASEAESIFDECEESARALASKIDVDSNSLDLAIDCYMKGVSSAMQMYYRVIVEDTAIRICDGLLGTSRPDQETYALQETDAKIKKQWDDYKRFLTFRDMVESVARGNKYLPSAVKAFRELIENSYFDEPD